MHNRGIDNVTTRARVKSGDFIRYPDSWMPVEELGKRFPPYAPTANISSFINEHHRYYSECPLKNGFLVDLGIPGWLRREDALKLYELAYFSSGDILELGCFKGLSTSILSQAVLDSGAKKGITTVDAGLRYLLVARKNLAVRRLGKPVTMRWDDGTNACRQLAARGRRFGFVFVDHSHAYDAVAAVCRWLPELLVPGGFCLFHDFNDDRNNDPNEPEYGVSQAVTEHLRPPFEFYGIFGCTALYRYRS
jgi:predicted O-methyltransferase YrrM